MVTKQRKRDREGRTLIQVMIKALDGPVSQQSICRHQKEDCRRLVTVENNSELDDLLIKLYKELRDKDTILMRCSYHPTFITRRSEVD
jgi:hypothetical protein